MFRCSEKPRSYHPGEFLGEPALVAIMDERRQHVGCQCLCERIVAQSFQEILMVSWYRQTT